MTLKDAEQQRANRLAKIQSELPMAERLASRNAEQIPGLEQLVKDRDALKGDLKREWQKDPVAFTRHTESLRGTIETKRYQIEQVAAIRADIERLSEPIRVTSPIKVAWNEASEADRQQFLNDIQTLVREFKITEELA